jgi:thiol-disulfide isomerase/thioredoxin
MLQPNLRVCSSMLVLLAMCAANAPAREGAYAPDFAFALEGHRYSLSDWRGRVVVLDFWASWCGPCQRSLPEISRLNDRYSDVVFLGVNDESTTDIRRVTRDLGLTFPTILDADSSIAASFGIRAVPTTAIIDRHGRIAAIIEGLRTDGSVGRAIERARHAN